MTVAAPASVDMALAVRRKLASLQMCLDVLGPSDSNTSNSAWLFTRELSVVVEGSSLAAVVLSVAGPWTRPNSHNTAQFPRLSLEVYADSSRSGTEIIRPDAETLAWYVWSVFNVVLHRTTGFAEVWGAESEDPGVRVWGSQLLSHPEAYPTQDWLGGTRLQAFYGLSVG